MIEPLYQLIRREAKVDVDRRLLGGVAGKHLHIGRRDPLSSTGSRRKPAISRPQAQTVSILPATTPAAELTKAFLACYGSDVGTCDGVYDTSRYVAGTWTVDAL